MTGLPVADRRTVRATVLRRLDGLAPETLAIADLAAVAGPECSLELLIAASGRPPDAIVAARSFVVSDNSLQLHWRGAPPPRLTPSRRSALVFLLN